MKNGIIGAIVGVVLLAGGYFVGLQNVQPQQPAQQQVGSAVSADFPQAQYSFGGLIQYAYHKPMTPNASTTCSFTTPPATSTVTLLSWKISSSSSAANIVETGYSTTGIDATTTLLGTTYNVAGGAQGSAVASTSPTTGTPIFAPNTHISIKVGQYGASGNNGYPQGTCDAEFYVL